MKKLALLLFFSPVVAFSDEFKIPNLQQGMYSYSSANKIPDNAAASIVNFYTDIDDLAVERNGYVKRDTTVLGNPSPVYGLWDFTDSSGNNWIISYSSRTFYKNTIGQTPTAFGLVATTDQIPDCAKNLGKIMCVNGTDAAWTFDGTSTSTVSGAPLGTLIEPWRTRFVISNITGAKSTVRVSEDGDETNWVLGGLETDPFSFQIGGANDGENVRCLVGAYLDTMIVGRRNDLWGVNGFDQGDYNVRNISDQVGCIEPRTPKEVDGELVFLSARGLEAMNGRQIRQISEPVRNLTDVIVRNTANQQSDIQTTQADWAASTLNSSTLIDTITVSGNLQLTFPDFFDSFRNGSSGTKGVWTNYCYEPFGTCTPTKEIINGNLKLTSTASSDGQTIVSGAPVRGTTAGTTYYLKISSITTEVPSGENRLSLMVFSIGTTSSDPRTLGTGVDFIFKSSNTGNFYLLDVNSYTSGSANADTCGAPCTGDVPFGTPVFAWFNGSGYRVTLGDITFDTGSLSMGSFNGQIYLNYRDGGSETSSCEIDEFGLAPISASLSSFLPPSTTSQLLNIGSAISSWGPVTISDTRTGGTITYRFGSTTTASLSAISNYATISNGQVPSAAIGAYAAFQSSFTQTISSGVLSIGSFETTWNEGGVIPSPVSIVYDRRYWMSFSTNSIGTPQLDTVLVWQRNKSFVLHRGIYAGSFAYWRDNLYFGDSTGLGYVYKFDTGNNDDGSDITSSIITKSYDLGQFFRDKEFSKSYVGYFGGSSESGSFSLGYDLNRYGTSYSLGSVNLSEEQGQGAAKMWFPLNQLVRGREIQYTLSKTGTGSRLKLYDLATEFELKEAK